MERILLLMLLPASTCFGQQGDWASADTNKDGMVSAVELKVYVSRKLPGFDQFDALFKAIDKNDDGSVNALEFAGRMQAVAAVMQDGDQPKEPVEFVDRYERMFAGRRPKLGSTIEAGLSAFDSSGKPFSFASTRGKYTVIVFGCLT